MAEITWSSSQWLSPCPSSGMCLSPVVSASWTCRGWCQAPGTAWRSFPRLGLIASPLRLPSATLVEHSSPAPTSLRHCVDAHSPPAPSFIPKLESPLSAAGLSPVTLFLSRSPTASSFPVCQPCQHGPGSGCALGGCPWAEGWIPAQRAPGGLCCTTKEPGSREGQHQCHCVTAGARNVLPC